jgi:adenylate cyclase
MKYGVVGSHVNLTSRIQSYTTGGQILVSDTARREVGPNLKIGRQMQVRARGIDQPVTLYEVLGIARPYHLFLPETTDTLVTLAEEVPLTYEIVEANYLTGESFRGRLTKLSPKRAEVRLEKPVPVLSDLKIQLVGADGKDVPGALYAKVVGADPGSSDVFSIRFTSSSPEIEALLRTRLSR